MPLQMSIEKRGDLGEHGGRREDRLRIRVGLKWIAMFAIHDHQFRFDAGSAQGPLHPFRLRGRNNAIAIAMNQ